MWRWLSRWATSGNSVPEKRRVRVIRHDPVIRNMWSIRGKIRPFCFLILQFMIVPPAVAQLSPGPLTRAHSQLEGLKKCSECHELGNREVQDRCLGCHKEISSAAHRRQGTPWAGVRALRRLPHRAPRYRLRTDPLAGRAGEVRPQADGMGTDRRSREAGLPQVPQCGQGRGSRDARAGRKDPDRTYLGLPVACLDCHGDHHRSEQLKTDGVVRACTGCHNTAGWKPTVGFDHAKTVFPLSGRHLKADCAKCHPSLPVRAEDGKLPPSPKLAPVAHALCTDCHKDPHVGQLGPDCTKCHVTDTWKRISGDGFDHSRTKYPLLGRHKGAACADCHGGGKQKPVFAACRDCHRDAHQAEAHDARVVAPRTAIPSTGSRPPATGWTSMRSRPTRCAAPIRRCPACSATSR